MQEEKQTYKGIQKAMRDLMHYLGRLEVASLKRGGTTSDGKADVASVFDAIQNTANEHIRLLMMYENAM